MYVLLSPLHPLFIEPYYYKMVMDISRNLGRALKEKRKEQCSRAAG